MNSRILVSLTLLALLLASATPARASDEKATAVVADALVVRPACVAATLLGSAVFVIALPFSALTKNVHATAHVLISGPAHAAFVRPMGDFDEFIEN